MGFCSLSHAEVMTQKFAASSSPSDIPFNFRHTRLHLSYSISIDCLCSYFQSMLHPPQRLLSGRRPRGVARRRRAHSTRRRRCRRRQWGGSRGCGTGYRACGRTAEAAGHRALVRVGVRTDVRVHAIINMADEERTPEERAEVRQIITLRVLQCMAADSNVAPSTCVSGLI